MTTWTTRAFPLAAMLALGACNSDKDTDGTDSDTTPEETDTNNGGTGGDDTSGGGGGGFEFTQISYSIFFGIGDDGMPANVSIQDTDIGPTFTVETKDAAGDTCTFFYAIDPTMYAAAGIDDTDASDTDAVDVAGWIAANDVDFGFAIAPGHYTGAASGDPSERCGDLDVAYVNEQIIGDGTYTDLAEAVLQLGSTEPTYIGFNTDPSDAVLNDVVGTSVDHDKVLGGFMQFPFGIGQDNQQVFDAYGVWADLNEDGTPAVDGSGNLVFNDAADAVTDGIPARGYYQGGPAIYISFGQ